MNNGSSNFTPVYTPISSGYTTPNGNVVLSNGGSGFLTPTGNVIITNPK